MASENLNVKIAISAIGDHFVCPVCMNVFQDVHITHCGHRFCGTCIKEAIDRRQKCPCCNGTLKPDNIIRDLSFNELIKSIEKAKEDEEVAYLDSLIDESGSANEGRTNDMQYLIKEVLKKHLRQGLAVHEKYCQLIVDECEKRKRSLSTENEEEREEKINKYEHEKSESIRMVSEAYDRYLSEHIPHITVLPVTVTFVILHKKISIPEISIKPNSNINDFTRILYQEMEKLNDPILEIPDDARFFSFSTFTDSNYEVYENQIHQVINEKKKIPDLHIIPSGVKPVLQYGLKPGTKIVLYGEVKCLSDKPKACFSKTFDKEFPESMDYFRCVKCNFHWICKPCIESCHKDHEIEMYIQNHVPTWACCYCPRKKTCLILEKK